MQQQRADFYLRFSRYQQSREKFYGPKIKKAIEAQVQEYISTQKLSSINSSSIAHVLKALYKDAGHVYGGKIYNDLSKYIKIVNRNKKQAKERKPIGFNERLVQLMNEYFRTNILNTSEGIKQSTIQMIQRELQKASVEGLGFSDIVARITNSDLTANRARLIARTETVTAANRAAYFVAKESGLEVNKEWLACVDDRTRDTHLSINGRVIGIDEYFYAFWFFL